MKRTLWDEVKSFLRENKLKRVHTYVFEIRTSDKELIKKITEAVEIPERKEGAIPELISYSLFIIGDTWWVHRDGLTDFWTLKEWEAKDAKD